MTSTDVGVSTLAATQAVTALFTLLPPFAQCWETHPDDQEAVRRVRAGQIAGVCVALGVGGVLAGLARSATPLWVSAAVAGLVVGVYEVAARYTPSTAL